MVWRETRKKCWRERGNLKNGKKKICAFYQNSTWRKKISEKLPLENVLNETFLFLVNLSALLGYYCFTGAFLSCQDPALSIQISSIPISSPVAFLCISVVVPSHPWMTVCLHIKISVSPMLLKASKGYLPCSEHFATFVYHAVSILDLKFRIFENILLLILLVCCFWNVIEILLDRDAKTFLRWCIKCQHLQLLLFFSNCLMLLPNGHILPSY